MEPGCKRRGLRAEAFSPRFPTARGVGLKRAGVWLKPEKGSESIKAEKGPLRGDTPPLFLGTIVADKQILKNYI